jgi:phosphotriesterase-related protein
LVASLDEERSLAHVMTVRGPIDPSDLGATLSHEHIFVDVSERWDPSDLADPRVGAEPMHARHGAAARFSWTAFRDDLCQLHDVDYALIRDEVREFVTAGGNCIVELTNTGLNPAPLALRRIAEELDFHVVVGCGWYVHSLHPEWLETATIDDLEATLRAEVEVGIGGTDVRPGIIGEIGTSVELEPCEERVLRPPPRVAQATGLPINLHCEPPALRVVMQILDVLEDEGHDLGRTSLSHLDEIEEIDYHVRVLERGVLTGFDSFGHEGGYFTPTWRARSDLEKMGTLAALIELGYEDQLLISHDMCRKHFLHRFGGYGYDHVLRRVAPRLRKTFGVSDSAIAKLLVGNPRRLLSIDAPAAA